MNTKISTPIICLFVTVLLLASCGPKTLNDAEFADAARNVCSSLQSVSASLGQLDLAARSAAYRQAVDALVVLNITEKSAPEGTLLRSGLNGLADSFEKFDKAIDDAIDKANLEAPVSVAVTEHGTVLAFPGNNVLHVTELDIDPTIFLDLQANQLQVQEAATNLKLEECVVAWGEK